MAARKEAYAAENAERALAMEPPAYSAAVFLDLAVKMEALAEEERARAADSAEAASLKEKMKEKGLVDVSPMAALIRRRRMALSMTQDILAAAVGSGLASVRKWESGKIQPGSKWLKKLAHALGGTPEQYGDPRLALDALRICAT